MIYDPYFSSDQLSIFANIDLSIPRQVDIYTLWSAESNIKNHDLKALRDRYESSVESNLSNGLQNSTITIYITGNRSGEGPMHDRFLYTDTSGLDITTSINGLGKSDSKIKNFG